MLRSVFSVKFALVLAALAGLAVLIGGMPWGPG